MRQAEIDKTTKIQLSSELYASEIGGEAVILERSLGIYYNLNPMGAIIYKHLKEPTTISEISSFILKKYDVDSQRVEAILQDFIEQMINAKIVKVIS